MVTSASVVNASPTSSVERMLRVEAAETYGYQAVDVATDLSAVAF
ncbi:hypothetical protein [Kitasatospora sp. A2-31]|nr:hypothetical protein [Kitasatospora sp. A2-31]